VSLHVGVAGEEKKPGIPRLSKKTAQQVAQLEERIRTLRSEGAYAKALPLAKKLLTIRERYQKSWKSPKGSITWWETGDARRLVATLKQASALSLTDQTKLVEAERSDVNIDQLIADNRMPEARELLDRQLDIRKSLLGDDHFEVSICLHRIGMVLNKMNQPDQARDFIAHAVAIRRELLETYHPLLAASLHQLDVAMSFGKKTDVRRQLSISQEAWEIRDALFEDEDPETILYLMYYGGNLLFNGGDHRVAEEVFLKGLELRKKVFGEKSRDVLDSLKSLAGLCEKSGALDRAQKYCMEGIAIITGGDPELARGRPAIDLYLSIARISNRKGDKAAAKKYFLRGIESGESRPAYETGMLGSCRYNLANILFEEGDFIGAEEAYGKAADAFGKVSRFRQSTAVNLRRQGNVLIHLGDYAEAEQCLRKAVEIFESLGSKSHLSLAMTVRIFGLVFYARGDYLSAKRELLRGLELLKGVVSKTTILTAITRANLAMVHVELGEIDEAEAQCQRAMQVLEREQAEQALEGVSVTNRDCLGDAKIAMGIVQESRGEFEATAALYAEALTIFEDQFKHPHPKIADAIYRSAHLEYLLGDFRQAEKGFLESVEILTQLFGQVHPYVARSLRGLARAQYARGHFEGAENNLREALGLMELLRPQIAGGELERSAYADRLGLPTGASDFVRVMIARRRASRALDFFERGRSRAVLDLLARRDDDLVEQARRSGNVASAARLEKLLADEQAARERTTDAELRLQELHDRTDLDSVEKTRRIIESTETIEDERFRLGAATSAVLAELSSVYPDGRPAGTEAICAALDNNEVLLGYSWTEDALTLLLVSAKSSGFPIKGYVLREGRDAMNSLEELAATVRKSLADSVAADRDRRGIKVVGSRYEPETVPESIAKSQQLFQTLLPEEVWVRVKAVRRILVLGDGPLNEIPFEALVVDAGSNWRESRTFIDAGPEILYAPSASVWLDRIGARDDQLSRERGKVSALIIANPLFTRKRMKQKSQSHPLEESPSEREANDKKAAEISALDLIHLYGGERLKPLEGTKREGQRIKKVLERVGCKVDLVEGKDATLTQIVTKLSGKTFLHLATHGLTGSANRPYDASLALAPPRELTPDDMGFLRLEDLIRSWRGRLHRCELVVLSACETQHGIKTGDSYMALPIGFFFAGAPAVIASLWKVDDKNTPDLMSDFYGRMMDHSAPDKVTSFSAARKKFREENPHPYYWANFVYLGDPR